MIRASFAGTTVAEADHTVIVEGNHYFPPESVRQEYLTKTRSHSLCPWKGIAGYYTINVDGDEFPNAAWTYAHPSPLARKIKNHVAFWAGVEIEDDRR
ncbi:MAG: DUF427 domain-containing protein [Acidimicrobiales bacterium]